jgi:predicted kinase
MIKLVDILKEAVGQRPKAIFLAGPAGSGKTYITSQIVPPGLTVVNVDDTYEELLKASGLGTKIADFSQAQLSQAAQLMSKAQKATKEKYTQLTTDKNNIIIDGTGAASRPLLKKKAELEELGYDTLMLMIWVSPYTSLKRNATRDRALPPGIVLRTWKDVNKNVDVYKDAFDNNFILINNDPEAELEYDPKYAKDTFFKTVKGSGKQYPPEELAKKKQEIDAMNKEIQALVQQTPEFTTVEDAKSKIQAFIQ